MNTVVRRLYHLYEFVFTGGVILPSAFLLLLRLYFFWQLFLTGKAKLANIGKVSEFFSSLGIPLPTLNAYFIGSLECFGSLLLIVGLASRPLSLLISVSMMVAYVTADFEALSTFLSDSDKFVKADPFAFLLTALIIYIFGPGEFSADAVLKRKLVNSVKEKAAACDPSSRPIK
ncbi:MAG TPA: DoxX family protein [Chthoniobacterales bacterium]|jgi:putative oxidoreductase